MKATERWHSERLDTEITLVRWGSTGSPVIVFPTAGGDCEEIERFLMIDALGDLMAAGRIKVYSIDSLNGRAWLTGASPGHASWVQKSFDAAIRHEVVPAIRADCESRDIEIVAAGPSIGAFNALEILCRHPDVFSAAICMSGTYDLTGWLQGTWWDDFYLTSPLHFVPDLEPGPHLDFLRTRFVILAHGSGAWENPAESWTVAKTLGAQGIPNRVDDWGHDYPHDWATWRQMLPQYLEEVTSRG